MKSFRTRTVSTLIAIILALCCFACFSNEVLPEPQQEPLDRELRIYSGTFVTMMTGYAGVDWAGYGRTIFTEAPSHGTGGSTYGFSVGYRFFEYFSFEGLWFRLPSVEGLARTNVAGGNPIQDTGIISWVAIIDAKFLIRLFNYLYLDVSVGVGYRSLRVRPISAFTNNNAYYASPIVGAGLQYDFAQDWFVYIQAYYMLGYTRDICVAFGATNSKFLNSPQVGVYMLGAGYKFSI